MVDMVLLGDVIQVDRDMSVERVTQHEFEKTWGSRKQMRQEEGVMVLLHKE